MKPLIAMRAALAERDLFGELLVGDSWAAWRILPIAICGEALTDDERAVFESLTGRPRNPRAALMKLGLSADGEAEKRAQRPPSAPISQPFAITRMFSRPASAQRSRSFPLASGRLGRRSNISTVPSRQFRR
jgi:hypothetical protein